MRFILYSTLLTIAFFLEAQNLVPNHGFEEYDDLPNDYARFNGFVKSWVNPNSSDILLMPYATPDFLHMEAKGRGKLPESYFGTINPLFGEGIATFITYNDQLEDFREYITVELKEPLVPGKNYQVSFYLLHLAEYGKMATNGVALLFSHDQPIQEKGEPLKGRPQLTETGVVKHEHWKKITFFYEAEEAFSHLTIGNFWKDAHTTVKEENPNAQYGLSLYGIDEVAVFALEEEVSVSHDNEEGVGDLNGRKVVQKQTIEVNSTNFEISVWDHQSEDGDIISLQLNGDWILKDYMIKKEKKVIRVNIKPHGENRLILYAHNLGKYPPNTIALSSAGSPVHKVYELNADLKTSESVQFIYKPGDN